MSPLLLDAVLLLLLAGLVWVGYRQGFVVGLLSFLGFLAGGGIVLAGLPPLLSPIGWLDQHQLVRTGILVVLAFAGAVAGQAATMALGNWLRDRVHGRIPQLLDSLLGALVPGVLVLMVVWFVAGALQGTTSADLNRAMGQSRVLSAVDDLVPWEPAQPVGDLRNRLDQAGVTTALGGLTSGTVQSVEPPDPHVASSAAVLAEQESVVRVTGVADACLRPQQGSGFVVAPGKVVTNAHVVAGMQQPVVHLHGQSQEYPARIVVFDPGRDLAVLAVDGLSLTPLPLGVPQDPGASVVLAGYPLDGPLGFDAARVRARVMTVGSDIFGNPGVQRGIYSLYAHVQQGNSGGPLLTPDGRVIGVVVSRAPDDPTTGYAIRLTELRPVVESASAANAAVSTGGCASG